MNHNIYTKIFIVIALLFSSIFVSYSANCVIDPDADVAIGTALDSCMNSVGTNVRKQWGDDFNFWNGSNEIINNYIRGIGQILATVTVIMIVYGWFLMVASQWEEEKIKKWKDLIKWTLLWFIALVTAWWIVSIVIRTVFEFSRL